jgi:hypothetical protein
MQVVAAHTSTHTLTHSHSHTYTLTHIYIYTHIHTHSLSLTRTHTRPHTLDKVIKTIQHLMRCKPRQASLSKQIIKNKLSITNERINSFNK